MALSQRSTMRRAAAGAAVSRRCAVTVRAAAAKPRMQGPSKWGGQWAFLKQNNIKSVDPMVASKEMSSGRYVLVDVRPKSAYEKAHAEGSVNVPLYQSLDMTSGAIPLKALKFIMYAANGVSPIEPNPIFSEDLKTVLDGKGAIFTCEAGGTMKESVNFPQGKASRSLQACFRALYEEVTTKVLHLDRGLYGWYQCDLPFEGQQDYVPDVGRTPSAAAEPMLQQVRQSTGYEIRPDDQRK